MYRCILILIQWFVHSVLLAAAMCPDHTAPSLGVGIDTHGAPHVQIMNFISMVLANGTSQEGARAKPAELQMLWQILQLLCQHKGSLRSADAATGNVNDKRPGEHTAPISAAQYSCAKITMVASIYKQAGHGSMCLWTNCTIQPFLAIACQGSIFCATYKQWAMVHGLTSLYRIGVHDSCAICQPQHDTLQKPANLHILWSCMMLMQ